MSDTYDKVAKNIKPGWLKIKLHNDVKYADVSKIVEKHGLHTICDSGKCPNKAECWSRKTRHIHDTRRCLYPFMQVLCDQNR